MIKYVVQVVPQVRGRVIEVPVEPNSRVKKGDVLFRIDPTPFELQVQTLEAQLAATEGSVEAAERGTAVGQSAARSAVRAKLELARDAGEAVPRARGQRRRRPLRARAGGGGRAGARGDSSPRTSRPKPRCARASARPSGDDQAEVAQIKAQLANARWELSQTVFYAPADGTVINLQLRPGQMATALGALPVMTFVEDEFQVIALYHQNELHKVQPGDEAEIALADLSGPHHQGERRLDRLGPGAGPDPDERDAAADGRRAAAAGPLCRAARYRRAGPGSFPRGRAPSATAPSTRSTATTFISCARSSCASARS